MTFPEGKFIGNEQAWNDTFGFFLKETTTYYKERKRRRKNVYRTFFLAGGGGGKKEILEKMSPFLGGGDMIREVHKYETTWNDLPYKFEAGTPNIADVIGFAKAIEYLEKIGMDNIRNHELELTKYALEEMKKITREPKIYIKYSCLWDLFLTPKRNDLFKHLVYYL